MIKQESIKSFQKDFLKYMRFNNKPSFENLNVQRPGKPCMCLSISQPCFVLSYIPGQDISTVALCQVNPFLNLYVAVAYQC